MQNRPRNLEELRLLLARELEIEERLMTVDASFVGNLGVSSINAIIVVMALEEWFGFQISDEEAEGLRTLADVQAFLRAKGVAFQAA